MSLSTRARLRGKPSNQLINYNQGYDYRYLRFHCLQMDLGRSAPVVLSLCSRCLRECRKSIHAKASALQKLVCLVPKLMLGGLGTRLKVTSGGRPHTLCASLAWPDPTRKEGSGPIPNMYLYQHPTDNWGCDKWLWL